MMMTNDFWDTDDQSAPGSWNMSHLTSICKGKGGTPDPNSCRGVCLQKTLSKSISLVTCERLDKHTTTNGMSSQLGCQKGMGARGGSFTLRAMLHQRKNHGLDTFALFIDPKKTFDAARHDLIEPLLQKFGAPAKLTKLVSSMCKDMK